MPEATLAGEFHGRAVLVAGIDDIPVTGGASWLYYSADPFCQSDLQTVTEGEEGIGSHHGAGEASFEAADLIGDG